MISNDIRFRKSRKKNVYTIQTKLNGQWLTIGLLFDDERERDLEISELRKGARFGKLRIEGRNLFSLRGNKVTCMKIEGEECAK